MARDEDESKEQAFTPTETWRPSVREPRSNERDSIPSSGPSSPEDRSRIARDKLLDLRRLPVWEYQWEDTLNSITERATRPHLAARIAQEIARSAIQAEHATILVRGELGIGKTTLATIIRQEMLVLATAFGDDNSLAANELMRCSILEAEDLESVMEFAARINLASHDSSVILLGRPGTIDASAQWMKREASALVTMTPFETTRAVFRICLHDICEVVGLDEGRVAQLAELAGQLPRFMCTPFYFRALGEALLNLAPSSGLLHRTPLEVLQASIENRLGSDAFNDLVACALGEGDEIDIEEIPGILDSQGRFVHDGYRNVILAGATLQGRIKFERLCMIRNAIPAVRTLLDHLERTRRSKSVAQSGLIKQLEDFVGIERLDQVPFPIYVQGLVAATLRRLRLEKPAQQLRDRCLRLASEEASQSLRYYKSEEVLRWDISDALSLVGDPRLLKARRMNYSSDSEYFATVSQSSVIIGSESIPIRTDSAKPVLPYARQSVTIGPMWVARYLVTNELFQDFWSDPLRVNYYGATGEQWINDDSSLMAEIEGSFPIAARRCFWKETRDQASAEFAGLDRAIPILDIAQDRALRKSRVALWDPTQADSRFSAHGSPVVGITWWEAMAFARWWGVTKLPASGFPAGSTVSLLTDWEWEAVRRLFCEPTDTLDEATAARGAYGAHLRATSISSGTDGRINNVMRPLHVGLFPPPTEGGPFDLVGNVWEWTRSRVYGQIREAESEHPPFGFTIWKDENALEERIATTSWRDRVDDKGDLAYRAVRGASFFSVDDQAAWHPAYRLCDPPYSSYFDLGFRIAVYPPATVES